MRQIILDTETTGINPKEGHRIVEIGALEMVDRRLTGRSYHQYINPQRPVEDSFAIHGLSDEYLSGFPIFAEIASAFLDFAQGAELVIHNAGFDMGFLDHEYQLLQAQGLKLALPSQCCTVLDTLAMARAKFPGSRASLDALCKRFGVDNSNRQLHGALLDAELLAEVYLFLSGGQFDLGLGEDQDDAGRQQASILADSHAIAQLVAQIRTVELSEQERQAHLDFMSKMAAKTPLVWDSELS